MVVIRQLGFIKFDFSSIWLISFGFRVNVQNFSQYRAIHCWVMAKTMFYNMAFVRHLEFKSFEFWSQDISYCLVLIWYTLSYISSNSDDISLKYGDIAIFKMAVTSKRHYCRILHLHQNFAKIKQTILSSYRQNDVFNMASVCHFWSVMTSQYPVIDFHGPNIVLNFHIRFGSFRTSLTYARLATDRQTDRQTDADGRTDRHRNRLKPPPT